MQPGGKRGSISKESISTFLQGINSGEEDVCTACRLIDCTHIDGMVLQRLGGVSYLDQFQHVSCIKVIIIAH